MKNLIFVLTFFISSSAFVAGASNFRNIEKPKIDATITKKPTLASKIDPCQVCITIGEGKDAQTGCGASPSSCAEALYYAVESAYGSW